MFMIFLRGTQTWRETYKMHMVFLGLNSINKQLLHSMGLNWIQAFTINN